jgi:hypothetical protein
MVLKGLQQLAGPTAAMFGSITVGEKATPTTFAYIVCLVALAPDVRPLLGATRRTRWRKLWRVGRPFARRRICKIIGGKWRVGHPCEFSHEIRIGERLPARFGNRLSNLALDWLIR